MLRMAPQDEVGVSGGHLKDEAFEMMRTLIEPDA